MATVYFIPYTSRIIKAGALLPDVKVLLASWDAELDVAGNLEEARKRNILGKASRARVRDILAAFRNRYLESPETARVLVQLCRANVSDTVLDRILYFHATRADRLIHDVVTEVLAPIRERGRFEVSLQEVVQTLLRWSCEGKTAGRWSEATARRVAQGLLAALRDFGVLEGRLRKRLAPVYVPPAAFAYVAFRLGQEEPSGSRLLHHPEWRLFLLSPLDVEQGFLEAHQAGLLEYHAAGSVVRIEFPAASIEEYAHVITARTDRSA